MSYTYAYDPETATIAGSDFVAVVAKYHATAPQLSKNLMQFFQKQYITQT